jgi:transcriptional regulator with XRE-family HTH domain
LPIVCGSNRQVAQYHLFVSKRPNPLLGQLGTTIRRLRRQKGLSQEALADLAHVDRSYMSGIERGLRNISVLHIARIAMALQVPLCDLLHRHDDRPAAGYQLTPGEEAYGALGPGGELHDVSSAVEEVTRLLRVRSSIRRDIPEALPGQDPRGEWELPWYLCLG